VAVGADRVGQDVGVEAVVLVARRAVPRAQVLDLVRCDGEDGEPGLEQRIDDGPVGAFDTDCLDVGLPSVLTSDRSPALVCSTVQRMSAPPSGSTTAIAWLSLAQSMPAEGRRGPAGVLAFMACSLLLAQQVSTPRWSGT
jgi:hypothetical protein